MRRIVIRRQGRGEHIAGPVPHLSQESASVSFIVPVSKDADGCSVRKRETGDIDRVARSVLAPGAFFATIKAAAGISAKVLNLCYFRVEDLLGHGVERMPLPKFQRQCDIASGWRRLRGEWIGIEPSAIRPAASALPRFVQHRQGNVGSPQNVAAGESVSAQRRKLVRCGKADGVVQIEGRPRIVFGVLSQPCPRAQRDGQQAQQQQKATVQQEPPDTARNAKRVGLRL